MSNIDRQFRNAEHTRPVSAGQFKDAKALRLGLTSSRCRSGQAGRICDATAGERGCQNAQNFMIMAGSNLNKKQSNEFYLILTVILSETTGGLNG